LEITSLLPFEIPSSWSWARFSSIANFSIGKTPERKNPDFWNPSDFHWVSISDLKDKGHIAKTNEFISKKAASVCFSTKPVEAGTLLMSFKLTIGKTSILDIPAYFNEAIVAIKPFLVERSHLDFLFTFIGLLAQLAPKTSAIKGATLNSQKIAEIFLPVPPLAEQARIVARLEELEPLVARYGELEERNRKLDEGIADRLKKSVLKYAMDGKLVAQDPDDEPASELLKRIATEKAALVREGKIKPDKPARGEGEGADKNYYGNLPAGWAFVALGKLCDFKKGPFGSSLTKAMFVQNSAPNRIKVYEQCNVIQKDWKLSRYYVSFQQYLRMSSFAVKGGDILVSCAGTIGKVYSLPPDAEIGIMNQALMKVTLFSDDCRSFLLLALPSLLIGESNRGSAIKNIAPLSVIKKKTVMLPGKQEQFRITNRIAQIDDVIGQLEIKPR
jgi:restriction endonuclease S subunit